MSSLIAQVLVALNCKDWFVKYSNEFELGTYYDRQMLWKPTLLVPAFGVEFFTHKSIDIEMRTRRFQWACSPIYFYCRMCGSVFLSFAKLLGNA